MPGPEFRWIRHQVRIPAGSPVLALARMIPGAAAVCAIDGSPMLRGSGLVVTREP